MPLKAQLIGVLNSAWEKGGENHKVLGDIANMMGRLHYYHGSELKQTGNQKSIAADWFMRAVASFESISEGGSDALHALATASGHAGIVLQDVEGYDSSTAHRMFQQAQYLLSHEVHDPCVRATFWLRHGKMALHCRHFFQAIKFFLWGIAPIIACKWQLMRK